MSNQDNHLYQVTLLVYTEFEKGANPEFYFDNMKEVIKFMEICFDNNYEVEISRLNKGD